MNLPIALPAIGAHDVLALRPVIDLAVTALVLILLGLIAGRDRMHRLGAVLFGCAGLALAGNDALAIYRTPIFAFGGSYVNDGMTVVFEGIIIVATALSLLLFYAFERRTDIAAAIALTLWAACGALLMAGANTFMTLFLGLELLSLALYALCALSQRAAAREAALKYLMLSSAATAFALYGMALLYGVTGSVAFSALLSPTIVTPLYTLGLGLLLGGLAFKLGLVPFHIWMPDVFEGAPLPITAFMSIVTKAGTLAVVARLVYTAIPTAWLHTLLMPLWVLAALSMVVGSVAALAQTNLKRLLAYSGIAQIGYILAAFAGGTAYGLRYGIFYLAGYMCMNFGVFAGIALLSDENDEGARLVSYAGLSKRRPLLAFAMSICLLGLAGLPPTVGFTGKLLILASAVNAGATWLALILILGTALSLYAYAKIIRAMYTPVRADGVTAGVSSIPVATLPWLALAGAVVATIGFGFYPLVPSALLPLLR